MIRALSLGLLIALALSAGCAAGTTVDADATSEDALTSPPVALARAVKRAFDESGTDHMVVAGRADLGAKGKRAYDRILRHYGTNVYKMTKGATFAYVIVGDEGDDAGYSIEAYDATDTKILTGSSPSTAEPVAWEILGEAAAVDRATLASRKELGRKTQAEYEARGTTAMRAITRAELATWGSPLKTARAKFDALGRGGTYVVHAYRWETTITGHAGRDGAFLVVGDAGDDDGMQILVVNDFDAVVLRGSSPSTAEPIEWELPR